MSDNVIRDRRIDLYGSVSRALHDVEELYMDASEISTGGWTAENGDDEVRLYGEAAFEYILERNRDLISSVKSATVRYLEVGGAGDALADAEYALEQITPWLARSEKYSADYIAGTAAEAGSEWDWDSFHADDETMSA